MVDSVAGAVQPNFGNLCKPLDRFQRRVFCIRGRLQRQSIEVSIKKTQISHSKGPQSVMFFLLPGILFRRKRQVQSLVGFLINALENGRSLSKRRSKTALPANQAVGSAGLHGTTQLPTPLDLSDQVFVGGASYAVSTNGRTLQAQHPRTNLRTVGFGFAVRNWPS